ncbi:MAG: hypothetical protein IKP66_01200 [Lachnospiraceae bacterium]|nr:hypothetical protein [Lachnospiraceae bacterium]
MLKRVLSVLLILLFVFNSISVCISAPQTGNNGWAYPDVSNYDGSQIKIGRGDENSQPQSNGNWGYVDTSEYEGMPIGQLGKDNNSSGITDTTTNQIETMFFGSYPQNDESGNRKDPIEWLVLEKDIINNRALLFSSKILATDLYYNKRKEKITWEDSTVRRMLNDSFYNKAFTNEERTKILKTINVNNPNSKYDNDGGNDTEDYVFLLSEEEVRKYFTITKKAEADIIDKKIYAEATEYSKYENQSGDLKYPNSFWLRSSGRFEDSAQVVNQINITGIYLNLTGETVDKEQGIRPAVWISYVPSNSGNNASLSSEIVSESQDAISETNSNIIESTINIDNSVLGDNVHIEGADVIQNPDGSIQIGGTLQEGAKIIQKGSDDNDTQYETQDEIDRIISDSNEATLKKPIDRVYYYAKQDTTNKTVTSINKKNSSNGLLGTGLFSNKTYYNIEIKFNEDTKKRLSKYAELEWNGSYKSGQDWVLLAGNTINDLENVSWFGITPFKDSDRVANTKELSYYQNGKLQIHSLSANEQNRVYNKLKNAKVIVLATHNVIKDDRVVFSEEEKLGNVERFEYVKDDGSHINVVNAYIDCEEKVVEYTNDHNGYFLYVKDGFTGDLAYHEEIVAPKKKCSKFEILVFGNDSLSYSIYGNKVNFLAGKEVGGLKKFQVFGGKMDWIFKLNTKDGFEDYEKYYLENKDKW